MSKHANRHSVLGEGHWGGSLLFFFLVVFIFSRQFLSSFKEAIADPVYFFSVIMVALAVAAPALWIFNEGRRFFSEGRGGRSSSATENDLFKSLVELPDDYRAFQNITLGGNTFDVIVVGPKSLSVIGVCGEKYQKMERGGEILERVTRKKAKALEEFFEGKVVVNHILVRENARDGVETQHVESSKVIEPASLAPVLKGKNSEGSYPLRREVSEVLDRAWRGELEIT